MIQMDKHGNASPGAVSLLLLGRPRLTRDGEDLTRRIKYRKGLALLGYLAAHAGVWHSRERLADLLWPGLDLAAARTNLRQVLNNLATLLNREAVLLHKDVSTAALIPLPNSHIDIALLSDAALDQSRDSAPDARRWRQREAEPLVASLGGEFLAGLQLPDTPEFDEWLEATRIHFRSRGTLLLENLCRTQHAEGRSAEAVDSARRLVALSPLSENHNLLLMSLLAESGESRSALEAFGTLRHRLDLEMGMEPSSRLQALHDDIAHRLDSQGGRAVLAPRILAEQQYVAVMYCASDLLYDDDGECLAEQMEGIVSARGGAVISNIGRGVLAAFGLGDAAEHATMRALLAAHDLLSAANEDRHTLRLGVCAGRVLLRPGPGMPQLAGEIPDLAKLVGWSAAPGELLVSEPVALQTGEAFRFEAAGERTFPGMAGTHKLFRLCGRAAPETGEISPLAGRNEELAQLCACWEMASTGHAHVAVLRAPAGMGKTRLARELAEWVDAGGGNVRHVRCRLEDQHQPLAGMLALTDGMAETAQQDPPSKTVLFAAVIARLQGEAAEMPTLLLVDDLHWSDQATRELIRLLARSLERQKLLVLVTTRPDTLLDYPEDLTHCIDLAPLDASASLSMIAAHDPGNLIPASERADIVATCAGIPLFIERQVKSRLEGGHHQLNITELLQSELNALGADKQALHAAAVLGDRFERRHLCALLPAQDVAAALAHAIRQRLLAALSPETCAFRHALIREAAYDSLPTSRRKALHESAARMLIAETGHSAGEIAQHFSAAGCGREAVDWWVEAGKADMAGEFAADAMVSFRKALELLADDSAQRRSIRMQLGYAAQVAEGYGSPLTHRLFSDMLAEIEASPDRDPGQLFSALCGCYMGSSSFGKDDGLVIARRLQSLARSDAERLMACFALGNTLFWRGDLKEAATWQERGIALAANVPLNERIRYGVDDLAVTCRALHCWTLWFIGQEAAACAIGDEAIALARKGKRAHALCFALTLATAMHWCRGDVGKVAALAGESLALAKQYGFPLWEGIDGLFLLWAQASSGNMNDTGHLFAAASLLHKAIPGRTTTARWVAVHALLTCGEWDEAEKLLDVALREVEFQEEQYCLADLLQIKGKCLERRGETCAAQEIRRRAAGLAGEQAAQGLLARHGGPSAG